MFNTNVSELLVRMNSMTNKSLNNYNTLFVVPAQAGIHPSTSSGETGSPIGVGDDGTSWQDSLTLLGG